LPAGAAVSGFAMKVGGKEVAGEILERDKARQLYEEIVRRVRDPGLLEYVDRGLFRASVFPIPANGAVEVKLEYSETLPRDAGTATYRYPFDTGRYATGSYRDVLVDVRLRSSAPLRTIHCPSHESVLVSRAGEKEARVTLEAAELRADRDFVVAWHVSEDALAPVVLTHRGTEAEGFFFFSIAPRPEKPAVVPPKDVVFVIDTSGSMRGAKLEQVKKALRYGLAGLHAGDRFNLVEFSTEARRFREGLVEATEENRGLATKQVDTFEARGGTNIDDGLALGLAGLDAADRLQLVVLLTDGEPTVGITGPDEILRRLKDKNPRGRRVFVFGVGEDLNAKLLDRVARETGGTTQYIRSGENIEVPLSSFFDKIDSPVLTDLRLDLPAGDVADVYPRPLPDLFRGEQLEVFGRYRTDGAKTAVLRGRFQGEERVFEHSLDFKGGENPNLPRLWAQRKIGYLLEQMRLLGETREVKEEVIRLSKLHGIITPYTSYLILEDARIVERPPASEPLRLYRLAARDAIAGGAPGAAPPEALGREAERSLKSFRAESGASAVEASRAVSALKAGAASAGPAGDFLLNVVNAGGERVRQAGERTFYLQGDRWIDARLSAAEPAPESGKTRRVKYLSEDYFALLKAEPGIGKLLAVGPQVTFLWKEEVVVVEG